jgi:hypothetical protein
MLGFQESRKTSDGMMYLQKEIQDCVHTVEILLISSLNQWHLEGCSFAYSVCET